MIDSIKYFFVDVVPMVAIPLSFLMNLVVFSGRWHKFRFDFHKLEHVKLKLEIRKLKEELGDDVYRDVENTRSVNELDGLAKNNTPLRKALLRFLYYIMCGLKYVSLFLGFIISGMFLYIIGGDEPKDITLAPVFSVLFVNFIFYFGYFYLREWVGFNGKKVL